ncbi:ABC transporter permease [Pontibacter diazotrophicus]|uniref:Transport permease protein n=1 Tax=Pontibacter diazotrophicus TaxID=1400979 RepID=A0A3D8LBV9_9BACT|nr:ABC transporter permease [Pontibacter diazotrophicus]RDV14877.1 ABC transporter permease [Pontibacter diazotrophicus]
MSTTTTKKLVEKKESLDFTEDSISKEAHEEENWTLVIEPSSGLFDLKLKEVWRYRDLLQMFVRRDFVAVYKQTVLGPIWFFLQPLLTTITFTIVFGRIAGMSTGGVPPLLFYMAGITCWNYFSSCLTATSSTFRSNSGIFGKVYFPRLITPLAIVVSNMLKFGVQFLLFLAFMLYFLLEGTPIQPNLLLLLIPFLIIIMALLALGSGMIISALTTKYRDLQFLIGFAVQLGMYASAVIYPIAEVPQKYQLFIMANPMSGIIETFRLAFLGNGEFEWFYFLYPLTFSIFIFLLGVIIFNKVEKSFMDTV